MFDDYKIALRDFYKAQKDSNKLSPGMENPTCLSLKKEFFNAYSSNHSNYDTDSIKKFFQPAANYEEQLKNIDRIERDKLRPFIKLMKEGTILRDEEAAIALAWLLGFMPYAEWKAARQKGETISEAPVFEEEDLNTGGESDSEVKDDVESKEAIKENEGVQKTPLPPVKIPHKINFIAIALVSFIAIYLIWQIIIPGKIDQPSPTQKCMYWNGDHYVPAECDNYAADKTLIPLDIRVLNKMQKVRWPDLLTKKDIGKVWYAKTDGHHEYFTDSGRYPSDPQKKLKPLSAYILSNHVSYYRFILQTLMWSIASILLLVIVYFGIEKARRKRRTRIGNISDPTAFSQHPRNLHSLS